MLDNTSFSNKEIAHLKFSPNFKIKFGNDNGIIVFGHNGIGKTSISKFLVSKNSDSTYLNLEYNTKTDFVKQNSKHIEINTEIEEIQNLEAKLQELLISDTKSVFKNFGISNPATSKNISSSFNKLRLKVNQWKDSNEIDYIVSTSKEQLKK